MARVIVDTSAVLPVDQNFAGNVLPVGPAEDAHGQFRPARSHQARNADDLTTADPQIDVLDDSAIGVDGMVRGPVADLHQGSPDLGRARRVAVFHVPAHHAFDDPVFVDVVPMAIEGLDRAAVADDGDLVCHLRDLVQLVRDQDRRDALGFEAEKEIQEFLAVALVEARRRLVEDEELYLF